MPTGEPRVLDDRQVDVENSVRAQCVASHVAYPLASAGRRRVATEGLEEAGPTGIQDFLYRHVGEVQVRVEIRPDGIADGTPGVLTVGSAPLKTVKGGPLWNVKAELSCQPPRSLPWKPVPPRSTGSS